MKKLLIILLTLPLSAVAQVTLSPFISGGYFKEIPNVKKARVARDYEGLPSYEGAPRLVYLANLYSAKGNGFYAGGGVNIGLKKFPLSLQIEMAGEHLTLSTSGRLLERGRTEYDFDTSFFTGNSYIRYLRFTPSIVYSAVPYKHMILRAQAGISLLSADRNSPYTFYEYVNEYAAINAGLGIGFYGVMLTMQGNFGTANMYSGNRNFTLYSRRISAGINVNFRELLEACR